MLDKVARIEERYEELNALMADPAVVSDHVKMAEYAQEQADIADLVQDYRRYQALEKELADTRELLELDEDEEMREMAAAEIERIQKETDALYEQM